MVIETRAYTDDGSEIVNISRRFVADKDVILMSFKGLPSDGKQEVFEEIKKMMEV